nr:integrase, catalytic region, zinc finger, CCHC-type, peptidase aspartic, catalytic [Tanacetum cinerariifolium]
MLILKAVRVYTPHFRRDLGQKVSKLWERCDGYGDFKVSGSFSGCGDLTRSCSGCGDFTESNGGLTGYSGCLKGDGGGFIREKYTIFLGEVHHLLERSTPFAWEKYTYLLGRNYIIIAGVENRPPMLEKSMYDSWASHIRLFIKGKKTGRMMLDSIDNGPLV